MAAKAEFIWNGDEFSTEIRLRAGAQARQMAEETKARVEELTGVQGPPRSKPGEPPRMETGRLHGSFSVVEESEGVYSVVSDDPKDIELELGTRRMAPRPHLRPAFADVAARHAGQGNGG